MIERIDMKQWSVHGLSVLLFLVFGFASNVLGKSPPNIVVFLADDLGATDLGCFGSTFYETPNIDRLDIAARLQESLTTWRRDEGAKMPKANPRYKSQNSRMVKRSDSGERSSPARAPLTLPFC
jgi:hypothetical protein